VLGFGFGKGAPVADCPALYMLGTVNDQRGVLRSDDRLRARRMVASGVAGHRLPPS
jgi:hypothetical protein